MKKIIILGILALAIQSCAIADLRTKEIKKNAQPEDYNQLGKKWLKDAYVNSGFDRLKDHSTYQVIGNDHWKGLLGKMGNVWNWKKEKVALRFAVGNFDGQVEVLEGTKKGFTAGIQSWDYYEIENGAYNTNVKDDERIIFALSAFHYFFELVDRLNNAPFVTYYGMGELEGKSMVKVFVSWGNERTEDYDQYIVYIGKESGIIEAVTHTVRENYLPLSGFLYSSTRFTEFKEIDGISIPFTQTVQLKDPKDKLKRYVHQFKVTSFEWDAFDIQALRPNPNLEDIGDNKLVKNN